MASLFNDGSSNNELTMIHGTNGVNTIVVKFNKVVLILELFNIYHADSAMISITKQVKSLRMGCAEEWIRPWSGARERLPPVSSNSAHSSTVSLRT